MTKASKINTIIDQRIGRGVYEGKGRLDRVKAQKFFFETFRTEINKYRDFSDFVLTQIKNKKGEYYIMSEEDISFFEKVIAANPEKAITCLDMCIEECERLYKRFSRESIYISVVGDAGQGKSTLLQSISGLNNTIIPAASGGDCTGAKSIICNDENALKANIIFYSEKELLGQVQKYLDFLHKGKTLGSIREIIDLNLAEFRQKDMTVDQQAKFVHLEKYIHHFDEYVDNLGKIYTTENENEIRQFVAQFDAFGSQTYKYLGVKEVHIFTSFNYNDAGKIVLVDTIGLGDTAIGIPDKMMETLLNDSDAAIVLRKPDPERDGLRQKDVALYDMLNEKMGSRSIENWLFYAINVSENLRNTETGNIVYEALLGKTLKTALITKVDCGKVDDVEKKLLIPLLEKLSENLDSVDNDLMKNANEIFNSTYTEIFSLSGKVQKVLNNSFKTNANIGAIFDNEYQELPLSQKLHELNKKYERIKNCPCEVIETEIRNIINKMTIYCPEQEEILDRIEKGDAEAYRDNVYNYYADQTRTKIFEQFEEINNSTIVSLQENVIREIIEVFYYSGRLNTIPIYNEKSENLLDWFGKFIDEKLVDYPILRNSFLEIKNYRLNIEGLLEFKVNRSLELLDPDVGMERISFRGLTNEQVADIIEQSLLNTLTFVADTLLESINDLLQIPNNSFYARIRKLRDQIIFSPVGKKEVRNFYRDNCACIWKDKISLAVNMQEALGEWNNFYERIEKFCSKEKYNIKITN